MAFNIIRRILRRNDIPKLLFNDARQITLNSSVTNLPVKSSFSFQIQSGFNVRRKPFLYSCCRVYSANVLKAKDIDVYRNEHKITIIGQNIPDPYTDIESSKFPDYIKDFLRKQGFDKPTVIQAQGWPIALNGQNFVGIAQTGTGKTLSYLLPAVVHIKESKGRKGLGPRVLVLAPTRELARQIEEVAKDFQSLLGIRCACIYGGANRNKQADILQSGVDIVIATPGRLNDFLVSRVTNLSRCTYVVLDEADRMLDMGFEPQIRQALEGVPLERQIMMFSATWPKEVRSLAMDYLGSYVQVNVGSTELSANHNIQQHVYICDQEEKMDKFKSIMHRIGGDGFGKILVFTNTKRFVDTLALMLRRNGWPAVGIHGDKTQLQRDIVINKFKSGSTNILVATDVAARGLDVDGISHVINFDFPNTSEDYIHRIGRTGRQQNKGQSHTILTSENERQAKSLIAVLREAKQEVPQELLDMARNFDMSKTKDTTFRYKPRQQNMWNPNRRFNKYSKSNRY